MNKFRIWLRQQRYNWLFIYGLLYVGVYALLLIFIPQLMQGILGIIVSIVLFILAYIASSEIVRRL